MKWHLYIMAKGKGAPLTPGYTNDIIKTVAWYKNLNTMNWNAYYKLIYLETFDNEQDVMYRCQAFTTATRKQIKDLILTVNPIGIEYVIGVNIQI